MYDFVIENKKESFWDSIKIMLNGGWDNEH